MAGIPKKSRAKKELAGTVENSRLSTTKPPPTGAQTPSKLPLTFASPPEWLDEPEHIRIFNQLSVHLRQAAPLFEVDVYLVAAAARCIADYGKALADVKGNYVQTFGTGAQQISPQFQVMAKLEQSMFKYFDLLGVGHKSREAIEAFATTSGGESGGDAFSMFMEKIEANRTIV